MIALNSFQPYNLRDLEASIHGVQKEIDRRIITKCNMDLFIAGKASPKIKYRKSTLNNKRVKVEVDLSKLKVIKAELLYLYELSKMKLQYGCITKLIG